MRKYATHPSDTKYYTTEEIRRHFIISDLFTNDALKEYQIEGLKIYGTKPLKKSFTLDNDGEMILLNLGSNGKVEIDENCFYVDYLKGIATCGKNISLGCVENGIVPQFLIVIKHSNASYETKELDLIKPFIGQSLMAEIKDISYNNIDNFIKNGISIHLYTKDVLQLFGEIKESRHLILKEKETFIAPSWSINGSFGLADYKEICLSEINEEEKIDIDEII